MCYEWLSVKDDLPTYLKKVIIFCEGDGIDYGGWLTKKCGWLHSDGSEASGVTHWRPMLLRPPRRHTAKRRLSTVDEQMAVIAVAEWVANRNLHFYKNTKELRDAILAEFKIAPVEFRGEGKDD